MEGFEDSLEESDYGSQLSDIGDVAPLGDGSCPPSPLLESANSHKSIGSGGAPRMPVSRGSVQKSAPWPALGNSVNAEILAELKKVNARMGSFCEWLDSLDSRLKSVEDMQVNLSTSVSSSTEEKTKRRVPSRVSVS